MDWIILDWINENHRCSFGDMFFPLFTYSMSADLLWILVSIVLLIKPKTRAWGVLLLISSLVVTEIGVDLIKNIVERSRPFEINTDVTLLIEPPWGYSFPSGHTARAFAGATVLLLMSRKIGIVAMIYAAMIGFSRLYLYVHFPTDVIAGAILGVVIGYFVIYVCRKYVDGDKWYYPKSLDEN